MRRVARTLLALLIDHCLTSERAIWVDRDNLMRNPIVHAANE